jgi:hypothetical protein
MHHMLFDHETGPKRQLSFECCDSKNDNLLCLGKTSMGDMQCSAMRVGGLRAFSRFFFQPSQPREKLKTHENIKSDHGQLKGQSHSDLPATCFPLLGCVGDVVDDQEQVG